MSIHAQPLKKDEAVTDRAENDLDKAQAIEAGPGPGAKEIRKLTTGGRPTPQQIAGVLAAHPAEHDAIVALVQQLLGNAFVDQVLGQKQQPGEAADDMSRAAPTGALPKPSDLDAGAKAQELVASGLADENRLTNELFWLRYPTWRGLKLDAGTPGAKEWIRLRNEVARPALAVKQEQTAVEPVKPPAPVKPATPQAHVEPESPHPVAPPKPVEAAKVEPPKVEPPKAAPPKAAEPVKPVEAPKVEAPKVEAPKVEHASPLAPTAPAPTPSPPPAPVVTAPPVVAAPPAPTVEPEPKHGAAGSILLAASKGATVTSNADDQYFTQAGNSYQDSVGGNKRNWRGGSASHNTCGATSVTMALVSLAGSEAAAKDKICELLRSKGHLHAGAVCQVGSKTVPITKIIDDPALLEQVQLEDLVTAAAIGSTGDYKQATSARHLANVAKSSGLAADADFFAGGRPHLSKAAVRDKARDMLAQGQRLVAGTGGHYVYLAEMREDGVVVHDPAGARMSTGVDFVHGGPTRKWANSWLHELSNGSRRATLLRRVSTNPKAKPAFDKLAEIAHLRGADRKEALEAFYLEFPDDIDIGTANFYSLSDIAEFDVVLSIALGPAEQKADQKSDG